MGRQNLRLEPRYHAITNTPIVKSGLNVRDSDNCIVPERSTGIALVLALVVNIDSIHIADSYIRNESMRQGVIAQRDAFVEHYNALIETLEKEKNKDSVTKKELEQAFGDSRQQVDVLTSVGFPIGSIAILLMVAGFVMENADYEPELGAILFTIGFWVLIIPLAIIGIILLVVLIIYVFVK